MRYCLKLAAAIALAFVVGVTTQRGDLTTILWTVMITGLPTYGGSIHYRTGNLWAGFTSLWLSKDVGSTWIPIPGLPLTGNDVITDIRFFDQNTGLVVTKTEGVFKTIDQGTTWSRIIPGGVLLSFSADFARVKSLPSTAARMLLSAFRRRARSCRLCSRCFSLCRWAFTADACFNGINSEV